MKIILAVLAVLGILLIRPTDAQETKVYYVGPGSVVKWTHDGVDVGQAGLDRFEIEVLDSQQAVVDSIVVSEDVRESSLETVPEEAMHLQVRAVDKAGNASDWAVLDGRIIVDREAPPIVITITITIGKP